ncbi:MAG: methyl-accepting chemotaxis protein [Eubacterium sp.]|jgi:methyl-accepting chemotaxis protein|nr:methyl-accepting chemotaxis protein [Eubacterium sp.]
MKNLKVSIKLIISFSVVIVLAVLVGLIGIWGMYQINAADDDLYNNKYLPTVLAGDISQAIVEQRIVMRSLIIYDVNADAEQFQSAEDELAASRQKIDEMMAEYDGTISNDDDRATFDEFSEVYRNQWTPLVDNISELGLNNHAEEAKVMMTENSALAVNLNELTSRLQEINLTDGKNSVDGNTDLFFSMAAIEVGVLLVSVVIALFFALYLSRLISNPLKDMVGYIKQAGETGNLKFRDDEWANCDRLSQMKDEIGQTMKAFTQMMRKFVYYGETVEKVSERDLTIDVNTLGTDDTFGSAAKNMVDSLNDMLGEVNSSTSQVSGAAKQIADAAQTLAQGSTEQAATVEQLSSSISLIADKTKINSQMTDKAAVLANTIKGNAEKGSHQMDEMMKAVEEITDASNQIEKVIKVIDDIAFQTNILALNAAVEAARAGAAGKGFAVVAEEVRNLASKSAEAAKNTGGLIENSIEKANLGLNIATETSASLKEIVTGINESAEIMAQIAQLSDEQASAVAEVNTGIDQVAQVVQQNSATAEESAAAAEEMSGQATVLEDLIAQFKLKRNEIRL